MEKPNLSTAESFLKQGGYYWNCGMFVFRADRFMAMLERYQPAIFAALQGLAQGKKVSEVLDWRAVKALLPEGGEVEAIELGFCIACLDAGQAAQARPRLRSMVERFDDDSPEWLRTDVYNQLGCLSALEGDDVHAQACLSEVLLTQSYEWYCELLVACIAKAQGDPVGAEAALKKWLAGAQGHVSRAFAIGGNQWVLERLGTASPP